MQKQLFKSLLQVSHVIENIDYDRVVVFSQCFSRIET